MDNSEPLKDEVGQEEDETSVSEKEGVQIVESEQPEEWAPWRLVVSMSNPNAPAPVTMRSSESGARPWNIIHVIKAGRLLMKPPMRNKFTDEHEMRQVYSVIYDVFRYKSILNQTMDDVGFLAEHSNFLEFRLIVCLFLMELIRRRWEGRTRGEMQGINAQLEAAGYPFAEIEKAIWKHRVHFAAAIARVRIKHHAFEKIAALVNSLHQMGYSYSNSRTLCAGEYRFDRVCPRFITLRPPAHSNLGQLNLVKDGVIVLQEREFCEGASTLCRALREHDLRGVVAQTHASSPRCSAYLAAQLKELAAVLKAKSPAAPITPELGKLIVFGAGDSVESYVESLQLLGIDASVARIDDTSSVCVYSESVYCDTPSVINALDGVVAVLATPPNSYSAVTDPIDLVCGRGGDLALLEVLTETKIDKKGEARVQSVLEEQKKTLKTLLSKPQIQLILYETHSALEAENQAQVTRAVAEANRLAREKYAILTRKKSAKERPQSAKGNKDRLVVYPSTHSTISNTTFQSEEEHQDTSEKDTEDGEATPKKVKPLISNENFVLKKIPEIRGVKEKRPSSKSNPIPPIPPMPEDVTTPESQFPKDPDKDISDVIVPKCDLFEVGKLPAIGNGLDINYILDRDGCYLGLIQRKEMTRLDARYMIKVAEDRGLFDGAPVSAVPRRRKPEPQAAAPRRRRRKNNGFEIQLILYETHSALEAENQAQVTRAVAEANRLAREKYAILTRKKSAKERPQSAKGNKDRLVVYPSTHSTISNTTFQSEEEHQDTSEKDTEDGEATPKKVKPLISNENFVLKKIPEIRGVKEKRPSSKSNPIPPIPPMPEDVTTPESQFPKDPDKDISDVIVPKCDLFEVGKLPAIGNGLDINYILDRDGCYLGLIQRKEMTRLDARYMIKVAEDRGLFDGAPVSAVPRRRKPEPQAAAPRRRRRKNNGFEEMTRLDARYMIKVAEDRGLFDGAPVSAVPRRRKPEPQAAAPRRRRRKNNGFEVERVAAPTHSSIVRSRRDTAAYAAVTGVTPDDDEKHICEKHIRRQAAASAAVTTNCVCDSRHRAPPEPSRRARRASAPAEGPLSPTHCCRQPFPVAIHELELRPLTRRKIFAS